MTARIKKPSDELVKLAIQIDTAMNFEPDDRRFHEREEELHRRLDAVQELVDDVLKRSGHLPQEEPLIRNLEAERPWVFGRDKSKQS